MQLSQIPLKLQIPLVADSVGATKYWLYCAGLPLLASLLRTSAPLATVDRMTLGAQTRCLLSQRYTRKRFLSEWGFEFPLEPELQETVEVDSTEGSMTTAGKSLQTVAALEASPIESSTPSATELASAQLPQLEVVQLESHQLRSAKSRNHQARRLEQKSELKNAPIQPASQTKRLRLQNDSSYAEHEDNQYTGTLEQNHQQKHIEFNHSPQFHITEESQQQIQDISQLENEVEPREYSSLYQENCIESNTSDFDSTQEIKQAKNVQRQGSEASIIEQRTNQSKQSNKQNPELRKKAKSKQKRSPKPRRNYATENQTLADTVTSEHLIATAETEFISSPVQEKRSAASHDIETEGSTLHNLAQPRKSQQGKQRKLPAKPKSSIPKTANQPLDFRLNPVSINEFRADTTLTDSPLTGQTNQITQIFALKNDQALEPPLSQQFQTLTPPQGFSVGGQVADSRAPAKPIDASDTVPAMLTPGEFVVNAIDAQKHLPLLQHINQGGRLNTGSNQGQTAKIPQTMESNHTSLPTSFHRQLTSQSTIHSPSSSTTLQSGIFKGFDSNQSELDQPTDRYQHPALVFRSQQSSNSPSKPLPIDSPIEWHSIEDLLKISTDDQIHSNTTNSLGNIFSQRSDDSRSSKFAVSETISNASPTTSLQLSTETIEQASNNNQQEAKTLEAVMETLAQEIYARLHQRLLIERERQGIYAGRLSW